MADSLQAPPAIDPGEVDILGPSEAPYVMREVTSPPVASDEVTATTGELATTEGLPVSIRVEKGVHADPTREAQASSDDGVESTAPADSIVQTDGAVDLLVQSFDAKTVEALGGEVLAFGVTPPTDVIVKGGVWVEVVVDYSEFRWALGAEWSQRLQLVEWACDPSVAKVETRECGNPVPIADTKNDFAAGTLTASVHLGGQLIAAPGGESRATVLLAGNGATLGLSSAAGSFQATTLSTAGTWRVGGNTGSSAWIHTSRVREVRSFTLVAIQ